MSTIAYRDGVMAADTAICVGGSLCGGFVKVATGPNGDLAGAAGDATYAHAFLRWFEAGEAGEPPPARETDRNIDRAIIVRKEKPNTVLVYEPGGVYMAKASMFAIGSGRSEALGAMLAGANAVRAIHIAIALDPHTGGDVVAVAHKDD